MCNYALHTSINDSSMKIVHIVRRPSRYFRVPDYIIVWKKNNQLFHVTKNTDINKMTAEYISTYTETKYIIHEMSTADLCVYIFKIKKRKMEKR